jgi:hypothetical protein
LKVKKDIPSKGRATRGMRLMDLGEGDTAASLARMSAADLSIGGDEKSNGKEKPAEV